MLAADYKSGFSDFSKSPRSFAPNKKIKLRAANSYKEASALAYGRESECHDFESQRL